MIITELTKIDLIHTEVVLRSDGIVQANATDHNYTKDDIREIENAIGELTERQKALTLLVASDYTMMDAEAREFLATPESGAYSRAKAYVIKSMAQRLIMNFLIQVSAPKTPSKFFTEIDAALNWLKTFEEQEQISN